MTSDSQGPSTELLRALAPQVLSTLIRRYGGFDDCEDAVQEALLAAATSWPRAGVPDNPRGWLLTVASRKLIDEIRRDRARRDREDRVVVDPTSPLREVGAAEPGADSAIDAAPDAGPELDDALALIFLCCHPALSAPSQVALTLRAVGGLSTAEIAAAFLVPEPTMAQRISRGKARIRDVGARFEMPPPAQRPARSQAVLGVLYLIFNEGYSATSGPELQRADLTAEAIRLARAVRRMIPDDGEAAGLLALMLLTDSHRAARTDEHGGLVALADQDRTRWDRAQIEEGTALIAAALAAPDASAMPGPYQLQAAIAAVHAEAADAQRTDWAQIVALYRLLTRVAPNPMAQLGLAGAVAMLDGPRAGLALLEPLRADPRIAGHHRLAAVGAHLLERAGDLDAARAQYLEAARRATSLPERRYLLDRASRLDARQ